MAGGYFAIFRKYFRPREFLLQNLRPLEFFLISSNFYKPNLNNTDHDSDKIGFWIYFLASKR